jgi:hypothetical protein
MVTAGERIAPRAEAVAALIARMTAWEPEARPDAKQVHEACMGIAEDLPGLSLARFAPTAVPPLIAARRQRYRDEPLLPACELTAAPHRGERPDKGDAKALAPTERAPQRPPRIPQLGPTEGSATQPSAAPDPRARLLGASPASLSGPQRTGLAALQSLPTLLQATEEDTEASGPAPGRSPRLPPVEPQPTAPVAKSTAAKSAPSVEADAPADTAPLPAQPSGAPSRPAEPSAAPPQAAAPPAPQELPTAQAPAPLQSQDPRYLALFEALTARGAAAEPARAHQPSLYQALLAAERTEPAPRASAPVDSVELRRSAAPPAKPAPWSVRAVGMVSMAIAATAAVSASIGMALDRQAAGLTEARAGVAEPAGAAPSELRPEPDLAALAATEPEPSEEATPTAAPERPANASPRQAREERPAPAAPPAPSPAEAPAAAEPEAPATVLVRFISSPPGAQISVDGVNLGVTPTESVPVAVGRRRVTMSDGAATCQSDLRISPVGSNTVACDLASGMITRRH